MGARTSPEMLKAMRLIKRGKTAYEAAAAVGINRSTISRSPLYHAHLIAERKKAKGAKK